MIKLGVIGYGGRIGEMIKQMQTLHAAPFQQDVRVACVIDPNREAARKRMNERDRADAVFYESVDEMVRKGKPDGLLIGTRCDLHARYGIEAANYDLPLFLEKPVATSMEQAVGLERAFEKSRAQVVVSFPLRRSPHAAFVQKRLREGVIGHPEHILGVNYVPYGWTYFESWYRDHRTTQGLFLQKATHDFDYMMFLMGANITRVAAMMSLGRVRGGNKPAGLKCSACDEEDNCLESPQYRDGYCVGHCNDHACAFGSDIGTPETGMNEDSSNALVQFANGTQGVYTQVFYTRRDAGMRGATISGNGGTIILDWATNQVKTVRHHEPATDITTISAGGSHAGGDWHLCKNFIEIIRGRQSSQSTIWHGIQSVYTCLAAKESARTGQFVEVRQVGSAGA